MAANLLLVGAQISVLGFGLSILWRRLFSPIRTIPGPPLASVSRFWHLYHIIKGDQNLQLVNLHDKYGHFVRIAHNEVSVSHPDGIKKILLAPLHKANWYKFLSIPDYRYQTPMSTTDPKKKAERSRHLAAGYTMSNLLQTEDSIDNVIDQFMAWLDRSTESKEAVHLDKYLTYTAFDIAGEILFSKQFGFLKEGRDVGNAIANSLMLNVYASTMGFFRWIHVFLIGNPFVTSLNILPFGHLFDTTVCVLDDRLSNRDRSRFGVVDYWLKAMEKKPDQVSLRDIYAAATSAVGAASDTISCALQSFVYFMNRHPNAWERVRREIKEAQRTQGLCRNRVVKFADAQQLPFLQACIKEALRVFGPVPMTLPRLAPSGGLTIGSEHFPEGTILSINPWVMHHSKELWGSDAREFNPDRWLKDNVRELDKYFLPWGQGYNSCPGQHIARIELSKITATLVRDYEITQVDKNQDWQWKAYFTVVPHSWPCYIERRVGRKSVLSDAI